MVTHDKGFNETLAISLINDAKQTIGTKIVMLKNEGLKEMQKFNKDLN